jgi:S-adenosylmethionine:tRNA ribosyltransferase-isomerase
MTSPIRLSDYDYDLPKELIAQHPAKNRDESRLLVLDRKSGVIAHRRFRDIVDYLRKGDLLVLNDTKVIRARLLGRRATGGRVEALLLARNPQSETEGGALRASRNPKSKIFEALFKPAGRLRAGETIAFENGALRAELLERQEEGVWLARFEAPAGLQNALEKVGRVPLPPYIQRSDEADQTADGERYQTVYARRPGAVAAPTAGLHFTEDLLKDIAQRGVGLAYITLHVGLGTFKPITTDDVTQHKMHSEWYEISSPAAQEIAQAHARNDRIIAVGTTSCRVLESAGATGTVLPQRGSTDLFIYPPYRFQLTDALLTNFHLPRTTLLLLVCAFAGPDLILQAYREAINLRYRFYSFGDAMLIL